MNTKNIEHTVYYACKQLTFEKVKGWIFYKETVRSCCKFWKRKESYDPMFFFFLFLCRLRSKKNYQLSFYPSILLHCALICFIWLLGLIHLVQTHSSMSRLVSVSCSLATVLTRQVFAGQLLSWAWAIHAGGSGSANVSASFACSILSWDRTEAPTLHFNGKNVASCGGVRLCHLPSSLGFSPHRGMLFPCHH